MDPPCLISFFTLQWKSRRIHGLQTIRKGYWFRWVWGLFWWRTKEGFECHWSNIFIVTGLWNRTALMPIFNPLHTLHYSFVWPIWCPSGLGCISLKKMTMDIGSLTLLPCPRVGPLIVLVCFQERLHLAMLEGHLAVWS